MKFQLHELQIGPMVTRAIEEDWGHGDWTSDLCVLSKTHAEAQILAKEDCVVAGVDLAQHVFHRVDAALDVRIHTENGDTASVGDCLISVKGSARSILKAERVALNFLGKMSGIATLTRRYCQELEGFPTQLLDTRKTSPGLRLIEKSATMIGGARNHRFGLCDGVIVKENHIRAAGGIKAAVSRLLDSLPPTLKIEVETSCLAEVGEALEAGADLIMLDNMNIEQMTRAVELVNGRALLEASGNVKIEGLKEIAATGVHFISTSAIIHRARWSDLSLLFKV